MRSENRTGAKLVKIALVAATLAAAPLAAVVYNTFPDALKQLFPKDDVKRETLFLSREKLDAAQQLAGEDVSVGNGLVVYYRALHGNKLTATVFLDTHKVRTQNQTLLIAIDPAGRVVHVEALQFMEPKDYQAPDRWVNQFIGKKLKESLSLRGDIAALTGATLTARATTAAVRRALAFHAMINSRIR